MERQRKKTGKAESFDAAPQPAAKLIRDYMSAQIPKRSSRQLTGAKQWIALFLILIAAAAVYVGLYPWAFFMGGSLHPLGYWRGWGRMHSKNAGDYFLYVEIYPQTRNMQTTFPHTFVTGKGHLCTPKGQRFDLNLSGEMPPHIYLNTVGQPIRVGMYNWREVLPLGQQSRPSFSLWGRWGAGEIVADDRNTLSQAFMPDATLRPNGSHVLSSETEDVRITLHEGSYSNWESACGTAKKPQ
jgi:hypothetical protein